MLEKEKSALENELAKAEVYKDAARARGVEAQLKLTTQKIEDANARWRIFNHERHEPHEHNINFVCFRSCRSCCSWLIILAAARR
jgi:hypothetical protein